ncbi:lipocalin family protein [Pseudotabrizicola sp. L79]|uniref:lipocalin family protein n=1 Tax=Pseudotabrizicola sp. L79 TaxID=3118402 RepID=UPI002F954ED3
MRQLIPFLAALAVMGCAAKTPSPVQSFRKAGAPMWSNAQFDLSRLPGRWQQAAGFAPVGDEPCRPGGAEITGPSSAPTLAARLCLGGAETRLAGPMQPIGPGRFAVAGQEWWVIWVDTDYRTLAIATPSGAYGFILNRGGPLPPDRLRAAREIFDFNGYDVSRLVAY